jgi:hypothetical protein
VLPVMICQLDEELAVGFPIVLTLIHWPEPGVHLSIHRALHPIVQHGVCRANSVWIFRICVVSTTNLYSFEVAIELAPFAL